MRKCILDSSICIDLYNAGLIEIVRLLPFTFLIPDVIRYDELNEPTAILFESAGFEIGSFSPAEVEEVFALAQKYVKPSRIDLFSLVCAKNQHGILLTGDANLRTACNEERVEVHGVLWLLDRLVEEKILIPADAANALNRLIITGTRLPKEECEKRFQLWNKK